MPAEATWTLKKVLDWCTGYFERKQLDPPRLCAEMILSHVLQQPRIRLYTDMNRPLIEEELSTIRDLVRRAGEHEPIQYLTGSAGFFGMEFVVTPDVLIPRPETELLVERALGYLKLLVTTEPPRVLDLCAGSGCVAAAIAKHAKDAIVHAVDVSLPAIDVARQNVAHHKLDDRVTLHLGDLYSPIERLPDPAPFDQIVSNPPYIPSREIDDLEPNVRDFEPRVALDGGPDGLKVHRRIMENASRWLKPGGWILMEIAWNQGEAALELMQRHADFESAKLFKDFGKHDRVVAARKRVD